jgi:hypothetical protein
VDSCFLADILFNFRTAIPTVEDHELYDTRLSAIRVNYLQVSSLISFLDLLPSLLLP